jgi:hypothetical protein
MPPEEFKQTVKVDREHRVVLSVPELEAGTLVDVTVTTTAASLRGRTPGTAKGLLKILPGYDDPVPGFEDYS